ncbi:hypothetical protein L211DRAFT_843136, partial [Terfezia boudieri ATCC MYA-4762]
MLAPPSCGGPVDPGWVYPVTSSPSFLQLQLQLQLCRVSVGALALSHSSYAGPVTFLFLGAVLG